MFFKKRIEGIKKVSWVNQFSWCLSSISLIIIDVFNQSKCIKILIKKMVLMWVLPTFELRPPSLIFRFLEQFQMSSDILFLLEWSCGGHLRCAYVHSIKQFVRIYPFVRSFFYFLVYEGIVSCILDSSNMYYSWLCTSCPAKE